MTVTVTALIVGLLLFGMCSSVASVGKPRQPLTPGVAAGTILVSFALIAGVYWLASS